MEILLIGAESHGCPQQGGHGETGRRRVLHIGLSQQHIGLHKRPHAAVVVGRLLAHLVGGEHRGAIGGTRQVLHHLRGLLTRQPAEHCQRGCQRIHAVIQVALRRAHHPIVGRTGIPETIIYRLCQFCSGCGGFLCLLLAPQLVQHAAQQLAAEIVQHIRAESIGGRNICGRHPVRVALLAPVDEGSLTGAQQLLRRKHHGILLQRGHEHLHAPLQPLGIALHLVKRPGTQRPGHTVGRDRPATAGAGILHHHTTAHAGFQAGACGLRSCQHRAQSGSKSNITRPHRRPGSPGQQKALLRDIGLQLLRRQRIHGLQHRH